jgi:hypothetical protein
MAAVNRLVIIIYDTIIYVLNRESSLFFKYTNLTACDFRTTVIVFLFSFFTLFCFLMEIYEDHRHHLLENHHTMLGIYWKITILSSLVIFRHDHILTRCSHFLIYSDMGHNRAIVS